MNDGRMRRWLRDWWFVAVEAAASFGSLLLFCVGLALLPLMLITGGVLLMPQFVRALRGWSDLARQRSGGFRGESIPSPALALPRGATIDERLRYSFSPTVGREALWLTVHALPMLFVALLAAAIPLGIVQALAIPFYWYLAPADEPIVFAFPVTSWQSALLMPLVAVVYALISWALVPAVARMLALVTASMLTAPRKSALAERVDALTQSRAAALDAHAAELRRIERDLHDGAQNRLVSVVMMLGIAERAVENGSGDVVEQLRRAQDAATDALAGLRRTVHDIYPPILDELGLEGALASLAGRSAVPCTLELIDVGRVPAAVESASYFVVAEALTNANMYSEASTASVRVRRQGDRLEITVEDDGKGGAVERPGGGFAGIRRRTEAFEGTIELTSPVGGPTRLRVEMLCGS